MHCREDLQRNISLRFTCVRPPKDYYMEMKYSSNNSTPSSGGIDGDTLMQALVIGADAALDEKQRQINEANMIRQQQIQYQQILQKVLDAIIKMIKFVFTDTVSERLKKHWIHRGHLQRKARDPIRRLAPRHRLHRRSRLPGLLRAGNSFRLR